MPLKISTIVSYYGFHICALEQFNICAPNVPPFHFHSCDPYCFHICALDNFHRCHPRSIIFTSVPPPPLIVSTCVRKIISISLPPSFSYLSLNKFRICERSFSALKRKKSALRSTMTQTRINNLMILHVHKDKTDELSANKIGNEFVSNSDHRQSNFGKF